MAFAISSPADAVAKCTIISKSICVVDGDTVVINGEKIRIANIDAPEIGGAKCDAERRLARAAKNRLAQLLGSEDAITIKRGDPGSARLKDRYKRTLATLEVNERDIGEMLIAEELARPWRGKREPWCLSLKKKN